MERPVKSSNLSTQGAYSIGGVTWRLAFRLRWYGRRYEPEERRESARAGRGAEPKLIWV
jgi:hypothetical protein